jgi:isopenicillin N synthase-like dioxygenase
MQRITNDLFPSTTHRVSKPRNPSQRRNPRVSFPMAVYVWEQEVLEVLPCIEQPTYPPVRRSSSTRASPASSMGMVTR